MKDVKEILNMNYNDFISHYNVYPTMEEAKSKGYEAHHIVPRATQLNESLDDRCVRLTAFEHILAHYLYCRDYPEEESQFTALNMMCMLNARKLLEDEQKFLEQLPYLAEMREKGRENIYTEETRKKISEANKGKHNHSEETRKKLSEAHKGKTLSEEHKKKLLEANKGKTRSEETRKKQSEAHKGKTPYNKGKTLSEEHKKKISEAKKAMTEETRKKMSEAHKGKTLSEENKKKLLEAHKGKTLSEETRKKISEANKGKTRSEEIRKKISEAKKAMTEETRKKISEANKGEKSPVAKKVFQRDLNGNILQVFSTVKEAGLFLGKDRSTITRYLHGETPKNLNFTLSYN